jgi:DNA polymerase-3 subunit alpha
VGDARDPQTAIERAIRFGGAMQLASSSMQNSLFGDDHAETVSVPTFANTEPWNATERLRKEKEVIGFYVSGHPLDEYRFEIRSFCNTTADQLSDLHALKNREIAMAGILTEVQHRLSKTGKPFGTFTIEDYTGSYRTSIFGEDYMKVKDFLAQEAFVFMRARVQGRFHDPEQLELRPTLLTYLSDLTDKLARSFTVKMAVSSISEQLIERMLEMLGNSPGNCPLKIQLVDPVDNISVELPSKRMKVKIHRRLLDDLESIGITEFKMN